MNAENLILANAATIENYGNVMRAKGLHERADWAHNLAREIRQQAIQPAPLVKVAA